MHEMQYREGTYDREILKEVGRPNLYLNFLDPQPTDIVLDIGAHIGGFAVSIADKVRRVYCYEPSVDNFGFLEANTKHLPQVIRVNQGVYSKTMNMSLQLNGGINTGNHSLLPIRNRHSVPVKVKSIDSILARHKITKIKMDCEGSEFAIIESWKRYPQITHLAVEVHLNIWGKSGKDKFHTIVGLLQEQFTDVTYPNINKHWHCMVYAKR